MLDIWLLTLLLLAQGLGRRHRLRRSWACKADKPSFEQDGLEFFVCNGGTGLGGVRKNRTPGRRFMSPSIWPPRPRAPRGAFSASRADWKKYRRYLDK